MKENRRCDTCRNKGSRVEMVLPNCSATVDYCRKGMIIYKAEPCDQENPNDWSKIAKWFDLEGKIDKMNLGS